MKLSCNALQERYSCRCFDEDCEIALNMMEQLVYAASLAPSGKNIQPWKFKVVQDNNFGAFLQETLPNNKWLKIHKQFICVFLNLEASYDMVKDCMAIGAAIENLLIEATSNRIDTCWIGECTTYAQKIGEFLKIDCKYQLCAIIAIGKRNRKTPIKTRNKKSLLDIVIT